MTDDAGSLLGTGIGLAVAGVGAGIAIHSIRNASRGLRFRRRRVIRRRRR